MQSSSDSASTSNTRHVPVLLQEVLEVLDIHEGHVVLDGTLGGGGHTEAFARALHGSGKLIGLDVDEGALNRVHERLKDTDTPLLLLKGNFRNAQELLREHAIAHVDRAFFDLGWSSDQLEVSQRGFSFQRDEPLTMTLSSDIAEDTLTAEEIVNTWEEENIADILYGWGGERYSRRIARTIVAKRKEIPITTTRQLADIVASAVPGVYRKGNRNPATKTFQALRIAVNDELGALAQLLATLPHIIARDARVAFLTFHSLEDKLVKESFRTWAREGMGVITPKKPIPPSDEEIRANPRSRSAKLRAFHFTHYEGTNTHT